MADKTAHCPTDGLNQKFRLAKDARGAKYIAVSLELSDQDLNPPVLRKINVDESCNLVYAGTFEHDIATFADYNARDERIRRNLLQPAKSANSGPLTVLIRLSVTAFASAGSLHSAGRTPILRNRPFSMSGMEK